MITARCHPALQDSRCEGSDDLVPRYIGLDLHARYIHGCVERLLYPGEYWKVRNDQTTEAEIGRAHV